MTIEQLKTAIEAKYAKSDKALVAGNSELAEAFERQAMALAMTDYIIGKDRISWYAQPLAADGTKGLIRRYKTKRAALAANIAR